MRWVTAFIAACLLVGGVARGAATTVPSTQPTTRPGEVKLPHLEIDTARKQVRMECQAVNAEMALEFLVCLTGTAEHETVLRSEARPSHLHLALLMIGLQPGAPLTRERNDLWLPPHGPRLKITCEFMKNGKTISVPAYRMMRNHASKKECGPMKWVFAGSRLTPQGQYAADITGHLISVVNFQYTTIDVGELKSNSNEALELEFNPDLCPKRGTPVWVVIEKAGD